MMRREAHSETVTLTLTRQERLLLERLAIQNGATMRGLLRYVIREEARRRGLLEHESEQEEASNASER